MITGIGGLHSPPAVIYIYKLKFRENLHRLPSPRLLIISVALDLEKLSKARSKQGEWPSNLDGIIARQCWVLNHFVKYFFVCMYKLSISTIIV